MITVPLPDPLVVSVMEMLLVVRVRLAASAGSCAA